MGPQTSIYQPLVAQLFRDELEESGYDTSGITDDFQLFQKYFTLCSRLVKPKPRNVIESDVFSCPEELKAGYDALKTKFRNGENVYANLHKPIKNINFDDLMLYDWNIQHFHLGLNERNGFVTRTGDVLLALIMDDTCYCVSIKPHGHWSDKELLEIINRNWPNLTKAYKMDANLVPEYSPSDEELASLRSMGVNVIQQLSDGSVVTPIGGGYQGDKSSTNAFWHASELRKIIYNSEKIIRQQILDNPDWDVKLEDFNHCYRNGLNIDIKTDKGCNATIAHVVDIRTFLS